MSVSRFGTHLSRLNEAWSAENELRDLTAGGKKLFRNLVLQSSTKTKFIILESLIVHSHKNR